MAHSVDQPFMGSSVMDQSLTDDHNDLVVFDSRLASGPSTRRSSVSPLKRGRREQPYPALGTSPISRSSSKEVLDDTAMGLSSQMKRELEAAIQKDVIPHVFPVCLSKWI